MRPPEGPSFPETWWPLHRRRLLDRLINKEHFYELCDQHGIDHPATFIYDGSMGHDFTLPFGPPYVAKPADSVATGSTNSRG